MNTNDEFTRLQELHDNQKKIIAKLQQEIQDVKEENAQLKQKILQLEDEQNIS